MNLLTILNDPKFKDLKLLTEDADLSQEIKYVESTETPDVNIYIEEKSLIITTGMYFEESQDGLIDFIDSLIEKDAAGIAIKVDRFLKKLDDKVIEHANEKKFPILLIPADMTLGSVYAEIVKELFNYSEDSLSYILNSQKIFSNMLLQKPNLNSILNTLKNITGIEVGLIDPFGNIESSTTLFKTLFDKTNTRSLVKKICNISSAVYQNKIKDKHGDYQNIYAYRINISTYYPYYLIVLDNKELDIEKAHLIIEQANFAISYTLSRNLGLGFFELQKYHLLFDEMLTLDTSSMIEHSYQLPDRIFPEGRLSMISLPNFDKLFAPHVRSEGYTLIYQWIEEKLSELEEFNLIPMEKDFYYLVMTSSTDEDLIINTLLKVSSGLMNSLGFETQITVGPKYNSLDYLRQSYTETMSSVEYGIKHPDYDNVYTTSPHSYRSLFAYIPEEQQKYFCQSVLKDLYYLDDVQTDELKNTLKIWLKNNCNISLTAEELYIHRNTVSYRLDKCKEILDSELEDPEELFNLRIAFHLLV